MASKNPNSEKLILPSDAFRVYELAPRQTDDISDIERNLRNNNIAPVDIPVSPDDFASLSLAYQRCIDECPDALDRTASLFDERYGSEIGHVHKECGIVNGVQVSDPKDLFHVHPVMATDEWRTALGDMPEALRDFIDRGLDIQSALRKIARQAIGDLEAGSYSNISKLYYPDGMEADSTRNRDVLRVIRYDAYDLYDQNGNEIKLGEVAKRHFDVGGMTVQAYTDDPEDEAGFWANSGGNMAPHEDRKHYPNKPGKGYLFAGQAHRKIYGSKDAINPLWHGVDRRIPNDRSKALEDGNLVLKSDGTTRVPERTAVILFTDTPDVDPRVTARDTKPNLE